MPFALNPNAQEFVSPSSSPSSPISDSYMAQAMQQAVIDEWELEANVSEHNLEELEEAEAWISLQADFAEWEAEQEALLAQ